MDFAQKLGTCIEVDPCNLVGYWVPPTSLIAVLMNPAKFNMENGDIQIKRVSSVAAGIGTRMLR